MDTGPSENDFCGTTIPLCLGGNGFGFAASEPKSLFGLGIVPGCVSIIRLSTDSLSCTCSGLSGTRCISVVVGITFRDSRFIELLSCDINLLNLPAFFPFLRASEILTTELPSSAIRT